MARRPLNPSRIWGFSASCQEVLTSVNVMPLTLDQN